MGKISQHKYGTWDFCVRMSVYTYIRLFKFSKINMNKKFLHIVLIKKHGKTIVYGSIVSEVHTFCTSSLIFENLNTLFCTLFSHQCFAKYFLLLLRIEHIPPSDQLPKANIKVFLTGILVHIDWMWNDVATISNIKNM